MIDLPYSLVIEATEEPNYFGFYSPDLEGFTGIGHSVEDCLYKAKWGMKEHVDLLREQRIPVPAPNPESANHDSECAGSRDPLSRAGSGLSHHAEITYWPSSARSAKSICWRSGTTSIPASANRWPGRSRRSTSR